MSNQHIEIVQAILDAGIHKLPDGRPATTEDELTQTVAYQEAFANLFKTVNTEGHNSSQVYAALHPKAIQNIAVFTEENVMVNAWVLNPNDVPFTLGFGKDADWTTGARILLDGGNIRYIEGGLQDTIPGQRVKVGPVNVEHNLAAADPAHRMAIRLPRGGKLTADLNATHDEPLPMFIPASDRLLTTPEKGVWNVNPNTGILSLDATAFGDVSVPIIGTVVGGEGAIRYSDRDDKVRITAAITPDTVINIKQPGQRIREVFGVPVGSTAAAYENALQSQRFVAAVRYGVSHPRNPDDLDNFDEEVARLTQDGFIVPNQHTGRPMMNIKNITPLQTENGLVKPTFVEAFGTRVHNIKQKGDGSWDISIAVGGDNDSPNAIGRSLAVQSPIAANPWATTTTGQDFDGNPTNVGAFFLWEAEIGGVELDVPEGADNIEAPSWVQNLMGGPNNAAPTPTTEAAVTTDTQVTGESS